MMAPTKPTDFPYESHYAEVLGSQMHYVENGSRDPAEICASDRKSSRRMAQASRSGSCSRTPDSGAF